MLRRYAPWSAVLLVCVFAGQAPSAESNTLLETRIRNVLELNSRRYLRVGQNTPWQIFHGILAYGRDFVILDESGQYVQAIPYILSNGSLGKQRLFERTEYGLRVIQTSVTEGHPNQFLMILALSGAPLNTPILLDGWRYQIHHLVTNAQYEYYRGQEASWTLVAFATYLPLDARWRNKYDQVVSIEGIVDYETSVSRQYAPCGGTHNLFGLAYALRKYQELHPDAELTGVWAAARAKLERYAQLTRTYQNPDGTFSTSFYSGRAASSDPETNMYATGHTLEWLALYLPESELASGWMERAVTALVAELERTSSQPLKCGPLYHALHGLRRYYERRYGTGQLAQQDLPDADRHRLAP